MFAGKLPKPQFELRHVKTYLGLCVYDRRRTLSGKIQASNFRLRFNVRYDRRNRNWKIPRFTR